MRYILHKRVSKTNTNIILCNIMNQILLFVDNSINVFLHNVFVNYNFVDIYLSNFIKKKSVIPVTQ
jgi:hypothetical protein